MLVPMGIAVLPQGKYSSSVLFKCAINMGQDDRPYHLQWGGDMSNVQQMNRIATAPGLIAALDQSGGSTPKALKLFGINERQYKCEDEMYDMIHQMRSRIIMSPVFNRDSIIGAILFEMTIDRKIGGKPTAQYLWEDLGIVPFLKVDKGLAEEHDGACLMKPIPGIQKLLSRAVSLGIFGTKMRSVINAASKSGIASVVSQQFDLAAMISAAGLVPIIEPEVSISIPDKSDAEAILLEEIQKCLFALTEDQKVIFKLTIPEKPNLYKPLIDHPGCLRVLALSGGYSISEANERLAKNFGMIASFSRALTEGLNANQTNDEFNAALQNNICSIKEASAAG